MKKVKILLALAMCSMYQSCSSDEVNMNPQEESLEKVVFKDDFETTAMYGPKKNTKPDG